MSDLIKQCDECRLNECINCEHSWADIQEIKKQLSEKDKEIERLKYLLLDKENKSTFFEQLYNQTIEDAKIVKDCGSFTALNKIIRKQVCNEIRHLSAIDVTNKQYIIDIELLDKIEKGEQQ